MTVNRGDSGNGDLLAAALRNLRARSGLTTRGLAELIDSSPAAVSNWERGERLPNENRLGQLLDALNAPDDEREQILGWRRQAEGPGQLVGGTPSIGAQLTKLIEYEQVARRITAAAPLVIPGLLQTADYARATLRRNTDIDTRVTLRMGRRDVLTRAMHPAELVAYIDTEVLVRPFASPAVMRDQLRHLLRMAERPNITIQLVSSTVAGYTPLMAGPFILMEFAAATPVVHLEHWSASAFLWDEADVERFTAAAEEIRNEAMTPARSTEVIAEIVGGMETTT
jgi:transcriptional regulator with XRE-family HTH domain